MAKRKHDVEQASEQRPRKRKAFTTPSSAATKAMIKHNAEASPLLRLPAEIRRKILIEVLGDRLIHVKSLYDEDYRYKSSPLPAQGSGNPCERWCLLVCHPHAVIPPAEGALERDNYSQSVSTDEDEDDIFGWPYDDSEESDEESEPSEEGTEATPTELPRHGVMEDSGQIEDQEQDAEADEPLISPYTSDNEDSTPNFSSDDTEYIWRGEKRTENFLISHQSEGQSHDSWRMAKEMMTDFDGTKICTNPANGRKYDREMHLVLLRTCRQIYAEANQVLWDTNIFSFNDAPSFTRFMGSRSAFHKRSLKKL